MTKKSSKKQNRNTSNSNNNFHYRQFDLPEVINMDDLAYASDDDLERRHSILTSEREKVAQIGVDTAPWEIEIAYVQREVKIRNSRKNAHERFVRSNPDASYYFDETGQTPVNDASPVN